jgi:hypothetical protein
MTYDSALMEDRAGHIEQAAKAYEEALTKNPPALAMLMNLAVLYWQSTEYGFWAGHQLSREFVGAAASRLGECLQRARSLFPSAAEPQFWTKYIAWSDLGEPFPVEECRQLLASEPTSLVPAMHLYAVSQGRDCANEASLLLQQCRADGTTRARYIASVIEGVAKRHGSS